jgi:hypothetical protein
VFGEYRDDVGPALQSHDPTTGHHLIKTHRPDPVARALIRSGTCRTIFTYRNPLECIACYMEAFGAPFEELIERAVAALDLLRFQTTADGVLFIPYEDVAGPPAAVVDAIGRYLGLAVDTTEAALIAERFSKDNVARYAAELQVHAAEAVGTLDSRGNITLFSPRHIRSDPTPAEALLSPEQRRAAIDRLDGAIDARGALVGGLARTLARLTS